MEQQLIKLIDRAVIKLLLEGTYPSDIYPDEVRDDITTDEKFMIQLEEFVEEHLESRLEFILEQGGYGKLTEIDLEDI